LQGQEFFIRAHLDERDDPWLDYGGEG